MKNCGFFTQSVTLALIISAGVLLLIMQAVLLNQFPRSGIVAYRQQAAEPSLPEVAPVVNLSTPPVKILVWKSTHNPPGAGTVQRIQRVINELNQEEDGAYCRNKYGGDDPAWDNLTCQFTLDTKQLDEVDAVSFSMFNSGYSQHDLPPTRKSNQLWISFIKETPPHSGWVDPLQNLFNWTMSYRPDSEIWSPYGIKLKLKKALQPNEPIMIGNVTVNEWITGKKELALGVVSHCQTASKREDLIRKMNQTRDQIVLHGYCGRRQNTKCGLESNYNQQCADYWYNLAKQFKFYLAFENSLCKDYITEKFWRSLDIGMVPVVYGGGDYALHAPPHSFVNAREFSSAGKLMAFLNNLANDKVEYAKYFEWRREYYVEQKWSRGYCLLCKAVRDHKTGKKRRNNVYSNLKLWWSRLPGSKVEACEKPQVFDD